MAITPAIAADPLPRDPDDPAIWVNRADPSRSLILGTMKVAAPEGALAVFGVDKRDSGVVRLHGRPVKADNPRASSNVSVT